MSTIGKNINELGRIAAEQTKVKYAAASVLLRC